MKQLTCEICGSTEMVKNDGVFVCSFCGSKYTIEEAKKMVIEGEVEVVGTVKVDEKEKFENYLTLSQNARDSGDGKCAVEYANKALEIAPKNAKAWISKMKSIEYIATLGNNRLVEIIEAGKNAIAYASESSMKQIEFEVYSYEALHALQLLMIATNKINDTDEIKKTFKRYCAISIMTASKNTLELDSKFIEIYDKIANEAVGMIMLIPDEVLVDYPELIKVISECAKQYECVTNALIDRYRIYGAIMNGSAKDAKNKFKIEILKKANEAKKISLERNAKEQEERNMKYWEEHQTEKLAFETEKTGLMEQINKLMEELEGLPESNKVKKLEEQITTISRKKSNLGFFKNKEKRELQSLIDDLNSQLNEINIIKKNASEPIQMKIDNLKKRIKEIDDELTKNR